jgi:hypothetical protein
LRGGEETAGEFQPAGHGIAQHRIGESSRRLLLPQVEKLLRQRLDVGRLRHG